MRDAETVTLTPFADDAATLTLGDLLVENGTRGVRLRGSLDLARDRAGLERARALKAAVDAVVAALEAEEAGGTLPERLPPPDAPERVRNPFA